MLDIEIDGLFNSIKRVADGATIPTRIVEWPDLSPRQITSLSTWLFHWHDEADRRDKRVFALFEGRSRVIQGMMSMQEMDDHVFVHLIESASKNRGKEKVFEGVPGKLMGFACVRSQELGFEASVAFDAKTELIAH